MNTRRTGCHCLISSIICLFVQLKKLASFLLFPLFMNDDQKPTARERSMLIPEAADVLGVSRRTVYYRIREGRLRTIRTRGGSQRVLWSSIEALLRSAMPSAAAEEKACGGPFAP